MAQKALSFILIGFILNMALYPIIVKAQNQDDKSIEKVKKEVTKIGINRRVRVKLSDGQKVNGFIREIKADDFIVVTNEKLNLETAIQFSQVKEIKYTGIGATGKTVIIIFGVAMGAGVLFLISLVGRN